MSEESESITYTTTIGVHPPAEKIEDRTGDDEIPFATVTYVYAMARQAQALAEAEGKKPVLNVYANDLSRLAVSLAKRYGVERLAAALEMALGLPSSDLDRTGLHQDEIEKERESIVRGVRGRIALVLASKETVPLLTEVVGEVDSLVCHVTRDPEFARFVVKFMKEVVSHLNDEYGLRQYGTIKRLLMCLLPRSLRPNLDNETAWDEKLPDAMYAPTQAAAGINTLPHLTYKGAKAGIIPGKTLQHIEDLTRSLGEYVADKFIKDGALTERIATEYKCSDEKGAFGWAFTPNDSYQRAPFYMIDLNGGSGHQPEKPRMIPLVAIEQGEVRQRLDSNFWYECIANGVGKTIQEQGVKESLSLVVDPVFRDVVTRNVTLQPVMRLSCQQAGMSDTEIKNLEHWRENQPRSTVCSDTAYNALVLFVAANIALKARQIYARF